MYEDEKKLLLEVCLDMLGANLVIGSSGNVSMKADEHLVITPSSVPYATMRTDDFVVLDLNAETVEGFRNPSVEKYAHLELYLSRPDAKAVVHSHGEYSTALALLNRSLPPVLDEVVPKLGGEIRLASYGMPGSKELAKNIVTAMEDRSAALMTNHGAICIGKTPREAFNNALLLERTCKIYLIALQVGTPTQLPEEVVEDEADIWEMMREF
jgi:L-fuculose-phosphate aldolase